MANIGKKMLRGFAKLLFFYKTTDIKVFRWHFCPLNIFFGMIRSIILEFICTFAKKV